MSRNTRNLSYTPKQIQTAGIDINQDGTRRNLLQVLAFPNVRFNDLKTLHDDLHNVDDKIADQISKDALYANYIDRQKLDIAAIQKDEGLKIPHAFDYEAIEGLSSELRTKLSRARPMNLGQAAKVDGITPAALLLLLSRLKKGNVSGNRMSDELGQNVSRETYDKLRAYQALIQKWNPSINLVAKSTLSDVWNRHIIDSAQVYFAALAKIINLDGYRFWWWIAWYCHRHTGTGRRSANQCNDG